LKRAGGRLATIDFCLALRSKVIRHSANHARSSLPAPGLKGPTAAHLQRPVDICAPEEPGQSDGQIGGGRSEIDEAFNDVLVGPCNAESPERSRSMPVRASRQTGFRGRWSKRAEKDDVLAEAAVTRDRHSDCAVRANAAKATEP